MCTVTLHISLRQYIKFVTYRSRYLERPLEAFFRSFVSGPTEKFSEAQLRCHVSVQAVAASP